MERVTRRFLLLAVLAASAGAQQLFAGDSCAHSSGQAGLCRRIDACPSALEEFRKRIKPTICSFEGTTPVVCCPSAGATATSTTSTTTTTATTTTTTTPSTADRVGEEGGRKATRMCERYAALVWHEGAASTLALDDDEPPERANTSDCGVPPAADLIIGGIAANPKEFPHQAAIGFGDDEDNVAWLCGGSLISERYVLTVAHCLTAGNRGRARWVRLGDLNLARSDDDARPQQLAVAELIRHPRYSPFSHYDDVALLRLERPAKLGAYVRPACLHVDSRVRREYLLASGWGLVDWADEEGSDELMKVSLKVVSAADCSRAYRSLAGTKKLKFGIQDDRMVCAGAKEGGKDTCRGDSGGPLQAVLQQPYCMYSIVGLTSFGSTICGARNSPAVYTRVSNYVPWIESIVWP